MRNTALLHLACVAGIVACILIAGDGCAANQPDTACAEANPPADCTTPPSDPEEATAAEGIVGQPGFVSLDTATGNTNSYLVPVGEGTPPAQLCSSGGCAALANGVTSAPIVDVITLPPVNAELTAPSIATVAYATSTTIYIVDMVRRAAAALSTITFTAPITDLTLARNGQFILATAGNTVTRINVGTQRADQTFTFPQNFQGTSTCQGSDENGGEIYTCSGGSGGCYSARGGTVSALAGISGGHVTCDAERGYVAGAERVYLFSTETGQTFTTHYLPGTNTSRCYLSEDSDCVYCAWRDGLNTSIVGFHTEDDLEFKRITLPGTNTFINGSITGRTLLIGQQNASGGSIYTCDRNLNCTSRNHNLNRSATLVPITQ